MWVRSLGWEDPQKREWLPTLLFLPGESHGQRSLVGYSPGSRKESDRIEQFILSLSRDSEGQGILVCCGPWCGKE